MSAFKTFSQPHKADATCSSKNLISRVATFYPMGTSKDCRFAGYSDEKYQCLNYCILHEKSTTRTQCKKCAEFEPGYLDGLSMMKLSPLTRECLLAQMPEDTLRFMQEVTIKLAIPPQLSAKTKALFLDQSELELYSALRKICTAKRKGNEVTLYYRGNTAIYIPQTKELRVNGKRYTPHALEVTGYQNFPQ
jgi:hypothetical protein